MTMLTKLLAGITLILMAFWAGTVGLWVTDRDPPSRPVRAEVLTPMVAPGGALATRYTVVRTDRCRALVERTFVDAAGVRYLLDDVDLAVTPGPLGEDTYVTETTVPPQARPGPARYRVAVVYACNPLHRVWPVVQVLDDVLFTIEG